MSLLTAKSAHGLIQVTVNKSKKSELGFWTKRDVAGCHRLVSTITAVENIKDEEGNDLSDDAVDVTAEIRIADESIFDEILEHFGNEEFTSARALSFVFALQAPVTYRSYEINGEQQFNIRVYVNAIENVEPVVSNSAGVKFESNEERVSMIKAAAQKSRDQRDNAVAALRAQYQANDNNLLNEVAAAAVVAK